MWINMHFNSRLQQVQENEIAAMMDQQALWAGNYVTVIEISGASRVPHNSVVPPCPCCQKFGGTCPRQLYGAGAYALSRVKLVCNIVTIVTTWNVALSRIMQFIAVKCWLVVQ